MALLCIASLLGSAVGSPINTTTDDSTLKKTQTPKHLYSGDGTVAAGWPDQSDWLPFRELWDLNYAVYMSKTDNSPQETEDIRDAISLVAGSTGVAPEFILACMIQESSGRVRVPTTSNDVQNPGLMQSYGLLTHGTCANVAPGHCTGEMITQMIRDGVASNSAGMGLVDLIARSGAQDVSKYYKATRYYNSGLNSMPPNGDLTSTVLGSTPSYSSDIANRLMGWTG